MRAVALADPAPGESIVGRNATADDLRRLGEMLAALVMQGTAGPRVSWPLPASADWDVLGASANRWRDFCKYLLDPLASETRTLDEVQRRLPALRPRRRLRALAAIPLLLAAAAGGAYYYRSLPPTSALPLPVLLSDRNPDPRFHLTVGTAGEKTEYVEDEGIRFHLSADRDCCVTVLVQDEAGSILLLLPNAWQGGQLRKGETINIPPDDYSPIPITAPFGKHMVKAIATPQPLRFTGVTPQLIAEQTCVTLDRGARVAMGNVDPALAPIETQSSLSELLGSRSWASAECAFRTRPRSP